MINSNFEWINNETPCFHVNPLNLTVLNKPVDFYNNLKLNISKSKKRIVLSSLYLGTGHLEQQLVDSIDKSLTENELNKVKILLDHNRGQRGTSSSKTLLLPLISKYEDRFDLYLYHTPKLRGLIKKIASERTNETIGIQHMKIYITDNDLIISGANLSHDYFDNRQDRYILIKDCEKLCDFFESLIDSVSSHSFKVDKSGSLTYSKQIHPIEDRKDEFATSLGADINNLLNKYKNMSLNDEAQLNNEENKLLIYPLIQMSDALIRTDEYVTNKFFQSVIEGSKIYLAVGYFNLTNEYMNTIVKESQAKFNLLLSSPEANGFFGAQGFSKYIPNIYSYLEEDFLKFCTENKQQDRISLFEYKRPNWTFHAKGLWYYPDNKINSLPTATIIGSSNFGHRSVQRDLEANLLIFTKNPHVQNQLNQERKNLFDNTIKVDFNLFLSEVRVVPFWLKMFTKSFRSFF